MSGIMNWGESYESSTPRETVGAATNLGQGLEQFTSGKGFEGLSGDVGRLTQDAAQPWMSGLGTFDTAGATNALLNPQAFNFGEFFGAHEAERGRQMQDSYGQSAIYGGSTGNRFSPGTNRLMSESAGQLTEGWAQTDIAALLQDLGRMDQSRGMGLNAARDLMGMGPALQNDMMKMIMQYLQPGEAIYDPGFARELVPALVSGGAYVAGQQAGGAAAAGG